MSEDTPADEPVEETVPPVVEEVPEETSGEGIDAPVEEERDPLEVLSLIHI